MKNKRSEDYQDYTPDTDNSRPVVTVDYERYAHFLDNADLTEDQKREFLQTLWNIIVEFVSMGFGVHPVQQAKGACGQNFKNPGNPPILGPDEVLLKTDILTKNFSDAADSETDAAAERVK